MARTRRWQVSTSKQRVDNFVSLWDNGNNTDANLTEQEDISIAPNYPTHISS